MTEEQRKRKNELDRLRRLRIKEEKLKKQSEEVKETEITEEKEITEETKEKEINEDTEITIKEPEESGEEKRKKLIADKRRETLALARAKRVNKSVIRDDSKK